LSYCAAHLPRFRLALKADGLDVADDIEPKFVLTVEGSPERVKAKLAARYGTTVTVPVSPSAQHLGYASGALGSDSGRRLFLRQEVKERTAGRALTEAGFRHDPAGEAYEAVGDAALDFWAKGKHALPKEWEMFAAAPPKVKIR